MSSTNYNPKFDLQRFMQTHEVKTGRGANAKIEQIVDWLDPRFLEILERLYPAHVHTVGEGDSLPNIAYFYHNTTTTWALIAAYNGIINWLSLKPGTKILIPDISNLSLAIRSSSPDTLKSNVVVV